MRKRNEENERIKRAYLGYLKQAKGQDETSLDKAAAAILMFEEATGFKSFKAFHIEQAGRFKVFLEKRKNKRTGKPLSLSTRDATLRLVKAFFHWLASQPGYKSRISYSDVEYFNNNSKNARAAHSQRPLPFPSIQQCAHAFQAMPEGSDEKLRDKAIFAFLMLTSARGSAVASLRLKHINLHDGYVFQDGREVDTKNSKTIDTWFFPVDPAYRRYFEDWVHYLSDVKFFGPEDALFPKARVGVLDGRFANLGLSRDPHGSSAKVRTVIKEAFAAVQMPPYTPHGYRKTLVGLGNEVCQTLEQMKAWSMNLGHENLATTAGSYLPVSRERQGEVLKGLGRKFTAYFVENLFLDRGKYR